MLGTHALSSGFYDAYYARASKVRELIKEDFAQAFQKVDAIIAPTAPTVAYKLGTKTDDPLTMYLEDLYTVTGSLAQIPGISVPCGYAAPDDDPDTKLPVGLQILGPQLGENTVLKVAHVFECSMKNILTKTPAIF